MLKKIQRLLIGAILCSISCAALASEITRPGLYLGLDPGYSTINYSASTFPSGFAPTSIKKSGSGVKIYAGYMFKKYFAAELSILYLVHPSFTGIPGHTNSIGVRNNILSLVGKGLLPLSQRFAAYANLGIGFTGRTGIQSGNTTVLPQGCFFRPVYGAGLIWNFYKNWNADANWTQMPSNSSDRVPMANFVGAGVFYKFNF